MAGRIEQLVGVNIDTGVKMYRDKSINKGTTALFDVSNGWSGGAKDLLAGATINDLTFNNAQATFNKPKSYANGGMTFAGVAADMFNMPVIATPQPGELHWMMTVWVKVVTPGGNSFNNQLMSFSTVANNSTLATMLAVVPTVTSGAVTLIELRVRGKSYTVTSQLSPLYNGSLHQFSVECEMSSDSTQQRIFVYLDKELVYSSGWAAPASTVPGAPTNRYIGTSASFPMTWGGSFYRVRKDNLLTSGLSALEVIKSDYDSSRNRFS